MQLHALSPASSGLVAIFQESYCESQSSIQASFVYLMALYLDQENLGVQNPRAVRVKARFSVVVEYLSIVGRHRRFCSQALRNFVSV